MKIEVLDHGFVELVDSMGSDLTVVNSARVSFNKRTDYLDYDKFYVDLQSHFEARHLIEQMPDGEEKSRKMAEWVIKAEYFDFFVVEHNKQGKILKYGDWKLLFHLAQHKHWSPFRHVQLQFHIKAPEFIMRQWYKHVVGIAYTENGAHTVDHAWNEMSMRYTDMSAASFYIPNEYRMQAEDNRQASTDETVERFLEVPQNISLNYTRVQDAVKSHVESSLQLYDAMRESNISKEQARMVLPLNVYTEVYWTCSLQALCNFIVLRDKAGAQYEIQQYANALNEVLRKVCPASAKALLEPDWKNLQFSK